MKFYLLMGCLLTLPLPGEGSINAQENISFIDTISDYVEQLEVQFEYPMQENLKFNMGDYKVMVDHEMSGIFTDTKERLLGMRVVTDVTRSLSFTVTGPCSDTAIVITEEVERMNAWYPN
jgi:hypothetical protein